jgi:hypothetical protein
LGRDILLRPPAANHQPLKLSSIQIAKKRTGSRVPPSSSGSLVAKSSDSHLPSEIRPGDARSPEPVPRSRAWRRKRAPGQDGGEGLRECRTLRAEEGEPQAGPVSWIEWSWSPSILATSALPAVALGHAPP